MPTIPACKSIPPTQSTFIGTCPFNGDATGSAFGQLLAYVHALDCAIAEVTVELAALRATHTVSEFPAYPSPIDREDEPLFAIWLKPRPEFFALCPETLPHLCIHGLNKGCCVTCEELTSLDNIVRRPAQIILHLELYGAVLQPSVHKEELRIQDVKREGGIRQVFSRCLQCGKESPSRYAFCDETEITNGLCKCLWLAKHPSACELPAPVVRFHQVTPEDVAWAERQVAFPRPRLMSAKALAEFFENHRLSRERKYANERALQVLAHRLGDQWADSHPEMEVSMSYFAPRKLLRIEHARTSMTLCGGKRLGVKKDCLEDDGEDDFADVATSFRRDTKRPERQVPKTVAVCKLKGCGKTFAKRKGTKHCSDDCRKRDWEQGQANNLPNSREATQ